MLTLYYHPISANARRVWVTLLEKQIPFTLQLVQLDGEHLSEDFTAINPLQRIPAIVDDGFRVIESLAILDYLEAKYPTPALLPTTPEAIAQVRMVETIAVVELQPLTIPLTRSQIGLAVEPEKVAIAQQRIALILHVLETLLGQQPYFAGETFTRADIVAGTLLPALPLTDYPQLTAWAERLSQRDSWQQTAIRPEDITAVLPHIRQILERRL